MVTSAKRMGFDLREMACLDFPTFVDVCAEWTGKGPDEAAGGATGATHTATQADIDRLLF